MKWWDESGYVDPSSTCIYPGSSPAPRGTIEWGEKQAHWSQQGRSATKPGYVCT